VQISGGGKQTEIIHTGRGETGVVIAEVGDFAADFAEHDGNNFCNAE
jgi:hypothetical protein